MWRLLPNNPLHRAQRYGDDFAILFELGLESRSRHIAAEWDMEDAYVDEILFGVARIAHGSIPAFGLALVLAVRGRTGKVG